MDNNLDLQAVEQYEDRGLLRTRYIYLNEHGERRVADSHCCTLGVSLGQSPMACVRYCYEKGQYSSAANAQLTALATNRITQEDYDRFLKKHTRFPDEMSDEDV